MKTKYYYSKRIRSAVRLGRYSLALMGLILFLSSTALGQGVSFSQWANETPGSWIPGALIPNNSQYYEGTSTLQRTVFVGIPTDGQQVLKFKVLAKKGNVFAYDFVTSFDQAFVDYDKMVGDDGAGLYDGYWDVNTLSGDKEALVEAGSIPNPATQQMIHDLYTGGNTITAEAAASDYPSNGANARVNEVITYYDGAYGGDRSVALYGSEAFTSASLKFDGFAKGGSDTYGLYTLTWVSNSNNVLVLMAGHLSVGEISSAPFNALSYGSGRGSSSISGGPYHFKLETLNGASLGNQDNQIQAGAIEPPPCILPAPEFTIQEALLCDTLTAPRLTVTNPVVATYTLTQPGQADKVFVYDGTNGPVVFTGLLPGIGGFSLTYNVDGCNSAAATCPTAATNLVSKPVVNETPTQELAKTQAKDLTAYPVPFSDKVTIQFTAQRNEHYVINLYDMHGTMVRELKAGKAKAGEVIRVEVDGKGMADSMYMARKVTKAGATSVTLLKNEQK